MYKGKSFLGIIPARGGSKGIPKKNIVLVNNKPLIQYTIDAALASKYLDDIIVSTDDKEIAKVSEQLGIKVPYLRPKFLATDEARTIDTIIHVIEEQKKLEKVYDYVVILQPTQPLRKTRHIDEAIERIIQYNQNELVSVSKVKEHPVLMRTINDKGILKSLLNINSTIRRQDFSDVYKVNGAIYINKVSKLNKDTSLNDNKFSYVMNVKYDLDIDDPQDLAMMYFIVKNKGIQINTFILIL